MVTNSIGVAHTDGGANTDKLNVAAANADLADFPGRNNGASPVGAASATNSASTLCYVKPGRL